MICHTYCPCCIFADALQVRAGAEVSNNELVKFASLFNDELTLDNLDRVQLVSMCQLLSIPPFGTDSFLKNRLRNNLEAIKQVGGGWPPCNSSSIAQTYTDR
jgi:LETM1 and EF-hand domain-containing protein 1